MLLTLDPQKGCKTSTGRPSSVAQRFAWHHLFGGVQIFAPRKTPSFWPRVQEVENCLLLTWPVASLLVFRVAQSSIKVQLLHKRDQPLNLSFRLADFYAKEHVTLCRNSPPPPLGPSSLPTITTTTTTTHSCAPHRSVSPLWIILEHWTTITPFPEWCYISRRTSMSHMGITLHGSQ